jgi:2-methoxy-6-polyprenyl-1,4-benzoquinol methylase
MCLEFSHVDNPLIRQFYDAYSFAVIPTMGQMVAQDRDSYQCVSKRAH